MAKQKLEPVKVVDRKKEVAKALLELVEKIHDEKKIARDVVFGGIEDAIKQAALRHFEVEEGVLVTIDRATGEIVARKGAEEIDPETLGRIAAQSAKQAMMQKIREAESDTVYNEFNGKKGELVVGTVTRAEPSVTIVSLGKSEALLPRSEQIPGETHAVGDRVKAVIFEVRRTGQRVKIVISRARPEFVRCLFEEEIPEIDDRTIDIKALAREAGYRTKMAVVSIDSKVDCVGACVGVRGSRIKNIIEELNGERIDIVRWNESLQILIPNALSPAEISEVFTYPRLGRAIVLVQEDQLSLAIGRRGQNVRLATKLVGMDIKIMTHDELGEQLERAERWFMQLPHADETVVQALVEEGFLSYNELTYIDGEELLKFAPQLSIEQAEELVEYAEEYAEHMDRMAEQERAESQQQQNEALLAEQQAEEAALAEQQALEAAALAEAGGEVAELPEAGLTSGESGADNSTDEIMAEGEAAPESTEAAEGHPVPDIVQEQRNGHSVGMPTDTEAVEISETHQAAQAGDDGEVTVQADGEFPPDRPVVGDPQNYPPSGDSA